MTVLELIEKLLECDEDAKIIVAQFGEGFDVGEMAEATSIYEEEGTVIIE